MDQQKQKRTILVVDDDPDIVAISKTVLESDGYNVLTALNGTDGLKKAGQFRPDLIILDVMMATATEGFHVAYDIRNDPNLAKTPILMLTAIEQKTGMHFSPKEDEDFLPVEDFVAKPIDSKELLARVKKLLDRPTGKK